MRTALSCLAVAAVIAAMQFAWAPGARASNQFLEDNWRQTYTTTNAWTGICEAQGRGTCRVASTYYLKTAGDNPAKGDVLVKVHSDVAMGVHYIVAVPFEGTCAGGTVEMQGSEPMPMVTSYGVCSSKKMFRKSVTNPYMQADLGVLRSADKLNVKLDLGGGETLGASIPMDGFAAAFDPLVAGGR
jgi:invasion protein IalB